MRNLRLPCDTRKPDIVPMTAGADLDVSRLLMAWAAAWRRWYGSPEPLPGDVVNVADRRELRRAA